MKKTILAITIICAALYTLAGVSYAQTNTIYACVNHSDGTLRIVSSLTECKKNEGPLSWNVAAGQQCAQGRVVSGFDQQGNIICVAVPPFAIGDTGPAGGIVFYVTDGGLHGLEAAPQDQGAGIWGCEGTDIPGADGDAVGTGAQNTADILAGCTQSGIAAEIAHAYTLNGYSDWFLPSKDELNLLYQQRGVVGGGFIAYNYWSSTENDNNNLAWSLDFFSGFFEDGGKDSPYFYYVRAVRAF
jgi:hypothetical protein